MSSKPRLSVVTLRSAGLLFVLFTGCGESREAQMARVTKSVGRLRDALSSALEGYQERATLGGKEYDLTYLKKPPDPLEDKKLPDPLEDVAVRRDSGGFAGVGLPFTLKATPVKADATQELYVEANYWDRDKRLVFGHAYAKSKLFGGPEEQKDHERLLANTGVTFVFHPLTKDLRQAAALVKQCDAFLSVDTALMHIAAAMKVPKQFVIETPTWNKPIEPYNNPFVLIKNPAVAGRNLDYYRYDGHGIRGTADELKECMASVSVDAVFDALLSAWR